VLLAGSREFWIMNYVPLNRTHSYHQARLKDPTFFEGLNAEDRETLTQLAHLHVGTASDPPGM
jgi:hypothetical protein